VCQIGKASGVGTRQCTGVISDIGGNCFKQSDWERRRKQEMLNHTGVGHKGERGRTETGMECNEGEITLMFARMGGGK